MLEPEAIYFVRRGQEGLFSVAKFLDGAKRPAEVYECTAKSCTCYGSAKGRCKHQALVGVASQQASPKAYEFTAQGIRSYRLDIFS